MGKDFWQPLLDFFRQRLVVNKTIDPADADRIIVTDSPREVVDAITETAMHRFGLTYAPRMKRRWFFWE
jgi:predicted Rossmann-fold nucleotide-binding protein